MIRDGAFNDNPQLASITIGNNVDLYQDAFLGNFCDMYKQINQKAGTYILANGKWKRASSQ